MTNEEIRIKVAESLGWTHVQPIRYHGIKIVGVPPDAREPDLNFPTSDPDIWCALVPNYPESLDACAEFEATLTDEEWHIFSSEIVSITLWDRATDTVKRILQATPLQRCLAYLKTKMILP